ncbi:MAG TPA: hypothetical protein VGE93_06430 [Bryobacteraceae bacterium]
MPSSESDDAVDLSVTLASLTAEDIPADDFEPVGDAQPEESKGGFFSRFRKKSGTRKEMKPIPAMPKGGIAGPIAALYKRAGTFIQPFDAGCGTALIMGADDCGKAWEEVCRRNPQMRRYVLAMIATGANMELLVAHLPIIAAVAIHHVPAVRQMVTQTTEQMTKMFEQEMNRMKQENIPNANAA